MKMKLYAALILIVLLAGGAAYGWWWFDGRWRPKTIEKNQKEISSLLEKAGWVSRGNTGPKLYVICFRGCPDCVRYWTQELPKLHEAGVDARIILTARADLNGQQRSTPGERATVAELWVNRRFDLLERWMAAPPAEWTAQGILPADNDAARSAVVDQSRRLVEDLRPLLQANGVNVGETGIRYPTLVWWTRDGEMKACACERPETYRYVRKDLGA